LTNGKPYIINTWSSWGCDNWSSAICPQSSARRGWREQNYWESPAFLLQAWNPFTMTPGKESGEKP